MNVDSRLSHITCMSHKIKNVEEGAVSSIQNRLSTTTTDSVFPQTLSGSPDSVFPKSTSGAPAKGGGLTGLSPVAARSAPKREKQLATEDDHERLVRRVSYLKATSGVSDSEPELEEEKSAFLTPTSQAGRRTGRGQDNNNTIPAEDLPSPNSLLLSAETCSGPLHYKLDKINGKRATDRSWKQVWAVIKGRALLLYKDKSQALQSPICPEDQLSLRGSDVSIASDYTKKRHVIRLKTNSGSHVLLQAENEQAMTAWINSISAVAIHGHDPQTRDVHIPGIEGIIPLVDAYVPVSQSTTPKTSASSLVPYDHVPSSEDVSPLLGSKNNNKKISSPSKNKSPSGFSGSQKNRKSQGDVQGPKSGFRTGWKGRLGRQFRKMQGTSHSTAPSEILPEGASIGVHLHQCPPCPDNEFLPLLVSLCVGVVDKGLHMQGLYRIPGNRAAVTYLTEAVNRGPNAIDLSDPKWSDVNVISSLLKQFLRKLPDPVITSELYPHFIEACKIEDQKQRFVELKILVQELPDHHYETLRYLCNHLHRVAANSEQNKMDARNLAIIFAPTLVGSTENNVEILATNMSHQCRIVELLISQSNWFFNDETDDPPPDLLLVSTNSNSTNHESQNFDSGSADLESSSYSVLLENVPKLEASQKCPKKMLVSSIISAANKRVQRSRKKAEEETSTENSDPGPLNGVHEPYILNHTTTRRASTGFNFSSRNREARIYDENLATISGSGNALNSPVISFEMPNSNNSQNSVKNDPLIYNSFKSSNHSPNTSSSMTNTSNPTSLNRSPLTTRTAKTYSMINPPVSTDDLAIRSYAGLNASTQERIRRFEQETKAMLQREPRHRKENNGVIDKQKLEEELQKAKKDLETEDIFDRLADNPSQVVHMMNDYCWSPNRETVGENSRQLNLGFNPTSVIQRYSAPNPSSLFSSPAPTNQTVQVEKGASDRNCVENGQRQTNAEGSDMLSAINATFEKMKSQKDPNHINESQTNNDSPTIEPCTTPTSDFKSAVDSSTLSDSHSSSSTSSLCTVASRGSSKCKLYRDPSLHRRRASSTVVGKVSPLSIEKSSSCDRDSEVFSSTSTVSSDESLKEKTEKRNRDLLRTGTQESLREKRPKEMKRSNEFSLGEIKKSESEMDRSEKVISSELNDADVLTLAPSTQENQTNIISSPEQGRISDNSMENKMNLLNNSMGNKLQLISNSQELRSRRHNVKELMQKFEKVPPLIASNRSPSPITEKGTQNRASMKQTRKSRIKRRHTVGGMKDVARVAWVKVIEAAYCTNKIPQGCQMASRNAPMPSWNQLQLFLEAFADDQNIMLDSEALSSWVAKERLGNSNPDLDTILSILLPPTQKEALKRRLSVREQPLKPLHPVLESNV